MVVLHQKRSGKWYFVPASCLHRSSLLAFSLFFYVGALQLPFGGAICVDHSRSPWHCSSELGFLVHDSNFSPDLQNLPPAVSRWARHTAMHHSLRINDRGAARSSDSFWGRPHARQQSGGWQGDVDMDAALGNLLGGGTTFAVSSH